MGKNVCALLFFPPANPSWVAARPIAGGCICSEMGASM
jgi:hypothetical protein